MWTLNENAKSKYSQYESEPVKNNGVTLSVGVSLDQYQIDLGSLYNNVEYLLAKFRYQREQSRLENEIFSFFPRNRLNTGLNPSLI